MPRNEKTDKAAERRETGGGFDFDEQSDLVGLFDKVTRLIDEEKAGEGEGQDAGAGEGQEGSEGEVQGAGA